MSPKSVSVFSKSILPAAFCMAVSAAAHAADLTWDAGTSTNWNTTQDNWTTAATWDNSIPDSAIFGSTGVGIVTLGEGITAQNITFDTAGYTIAGNTLSIGTAGDTQITANADATISSNLAGGSGTVYKNGSAKLTLTGTNTYGGGIVINAGTLEITSMSNISSAWLAMDNSSTLRYIGTGSESTSRDLWINNAAGTRTFEIVNAGASLTLSGGGGQISRSIRKAGDGTLVIGKVVEGGPETIIDAGILDVSSAGKLYGAGYTASPVITVNNGGTLRLNGWSWDAAGGIANLDYGRDRLVVNGGTIEYTGNSNFNPGDPGTASRNLTVGTGGATLKASSTAGQTWTISTGNGNLINNESLTLDGAGAGEIQKVIEGNGSVTKTGAGTWTLSGANTYTGNTAISGGTLSLSSPSLDNASSVLIGSGATLNLNFSGNDIVGGLEINGSGPLAAGAYNSSHPTYGTYFTGSGTLLVVNGAGGTWTSHANGNWEEPSNWASNTIATGFNNTATFNAAAGATVTLTGGQTIGNLAFDVSDYTLAGAALTLDAAATPAISVATGRTATITATLDGIAGMTKTGAGTLVLTAANNISGETVVSGGVLQLGADSASNPQFGVLENSSQLTIESGATVWAMGANAFKGFSGGSMNVTLNGGTLTINDAVTEGGNHVLGYLILNGGTISGVGQAFYGGFNLNDTVEVIENTNISATNTNTIGANRTIIVSDGKTLDWSGTIIDFNATAASSSLTFDGTGSTVLSGSNTYTGSTTINDGTLNVSSTGSLRFRPTTNGATNAVSGSSTATLSFLGTVNLDLGAAVAAGGNTWTLFNLASYSGLTPTAVTSTLGSFTEVTSGTWERPATGAKWVFTESNGQLAYVVTATDYDTWKTANGVTGGENDDDDSDGLTNHDEYAFGLDPTGGSSVNPITGQLNKTNGTFSYQRRDNGLTGLDYTVWYSTDLNVWLQDSTAQQVEGTPDGNGVEVITVTLSNAPGNPLPGNLFIQVRAE